MRHQLHKSRTLNCGRLLSVGEHDNRSITLKSLFDELVLKSLFDCNSLVRYLVKHLLYQIDAALWAAFSERARFKRRMFLFDHFECLFTVIGLERQSFSDHRVQNDTASPHVNLLLITNFLENFWCYISRCSTAIESDLSRRGQLRQAEICNFNWCNAAYFWALICVWMDFD